MAKVTTNAGKGNHECLVTVKHDGTTYEPGSRIDLTEDQAKALLAAGAIKEMKTSLKAE